MATPVVVKHMSKPHLGASSVLPFVPQTLRKVSETCDVPRLRYMFRPSIVTTNKAPIVADNAPFNRDTMDIYTLRYVPRVSIRTTNKHPCGREVLGTPTCRHDPSKPAPWDRWGPQQSQVEGLKSQSDDGRFQHLKKIIRHADGHTVSNAPDLF